jgi:NAD(P)-dependent dehydrogenase (short-subunit alcohol dehydrogenase family)
MKAVVITGANRGLGLELVKKFASEGWQVIAACRDTRKFPADKKSNNVQVLELDVANEKSIDAFVEIVSEVNLLINNAGIYDETSETSFANAARIFETNTFGPRVLTERLKAKFGKQLMTVLSISSGSGRFTHPHTGQRWMYGSSKAALNFAMFSFSLLRPDTFSVTVDPGWMHTDMGGSAAPQDPVDSAAKIFTLATKAEQLENGRMLDLNGKVLDW